MSRIFRGGVPTRSDVDTLFKMDPQPGDRITYEAVEQALGLRRTQSRFRTVTNAWRKRLFRERLVQSLVEDGAFVFLTAEGAHDNAVKGFTRLGRAAGRVLVKTEAIDVRNLPAEKVTQHNLLRREMHLVRETLAASVRTISPPRSSTGTAVRLVESR